MSKRVYPVPGRFRMDTPAVEHDCDDKACIESGAFTDQPPPKGRAKTTEEPADAGSSDSGTGA
jgi:hypothetical protein